MERNLPQFLYYLTWETKLQFWVLVKEMPNER